MSRIPSGHAFLSVPMFCFGSAAIESTVARDAGVADAWVCGLRDSHPRGRRLIVGLDCKWNKQPDDGRRSWTAPKAAVLQLCAGRSCLILQLLYVSCVPEVVRGFLGDPAVRFVGVGEGAARLAADHGTVCTAPVDLEGPCSEYLGLVGPTGMELKDYAREVLGLTMEKPVNVTMSDWEKRYLSVAQIKYACVDAYVCCRLGERVLGI